MWKVVTGMLAAASVLMLGSAALANDTTMPATGTETNDVQQQSGVENEKSFDAKSLKGQQAMKLQEALKSQGLYHGEIDGQIGPQTQEALRKFQEQKGFAASGKLDQKTASALGLEVSDIQPVSGSDDKSTQPEETATPMTNSGSTETGTGVDKAGESTTTKEAGELENQSGEETATPTPNEDAATETQPQSGSEESATTNEDMTSEGSGDASRFPQEGSTEEGNTDDTATQPQSGSDDTIDDQTEPQSGTDAGSDAGMNDDSTSPVTGGSTETEGTSPDTGDTIGNGQPATTGGVQTDNDSNVVNPSDIEPQAGTSSTFDKKTIKQVELALKQKKLFNGKADGVLDDQTSQAIRAFQSQQGLTVTGKLDAKTLSALGVKQSGTVNQSGNVNDSGNMDSNTNTNPGTDTNGGAMTTPNPNETPVTTPVEPTNPTDPGSMTPR